MIMERQMHFKVVGKDKHKGWFRTKYIVALRLNVYDMLGWAWGHSDTSFVEIPEKWDDMYALKRYRGVVKTIPTTFGTWCSLEIGEEYNITMYSSDNYNWFFHKEQADVKDD